MGFNSAFKGLMKVVISNLMKICAVGAKLIDARRRTDMTK